MVEARLTCMKLQCKNVHAAAVLFFCGLSGVSEYSVARDRLHPLGAYWQFLAIALCR